MWDAVQSWPTLSTKFAEAFAVLYVIRFPNSKDFCVNSLTSVFVLFQMRSVLLSASLFRPIIEFCSMTAERSGTPFGRAITMAAPTDNAHIKA